MTSLRLALVLALSLILSSSLLVAVHSAVDADEITSLPGWSGKLPSRHYSGYFPTTLPGQPSAGMLHYWLTLSEGNPASDPLVLWLQGGPGCSSLFGMLYENGQLKLSGDKDNSTGIPLLVQNPSAWTKVANMLWLEQPIGVGFSYCLPGAKGDCTGQNWGLDAYNFFVNFFVGYPELAKNPFHISGESWAGVYIPSVADAILTGNQQGKNPPINLVSLAIGNGVGGDADDNEQTRRESDFWYGHASFSYQQQQAIVMACGVNGSISSECQDMIGRAEQNVGPFYVYNIYDTCPHDLEQVPVAGLTDAQLQQTELALSLPMSRSSLKDIGFVCVLESASSDYLNNPKVQAAIHVSVANVSTWGPCGNTDKAGRHAWNRHRRQMMNKRGLIGQDADLGALYKKLIAELPILIYSGDVDQCVPYYYSDNWVRLLGFPVIESWRPWMYGGNDNRQVGGYVTTYDKANNLTFLTVRDSGHMVPQYAPEAALVLFTRFLKGGPY